MKLLILFAIAAANVLCAAEPFECRWASTPPKIDGKLDDEAWKHAQVVEPFVTAWLPEGHRTPLTKTKARLLWDREHLYFSAEMEDWDVFANVTEQDGAIWTCDVFELFFKPAKDKTGYYEFEVNAVNAKLDMFLPSRGAGGYNRHKSERDFHIESAVQVHGTLNNWSDKDKGWTVEGRIPWRDFLPTGGRPAPGEIWQHALCRYDYSAGLETQSLSSTAPLTKPDFHHYEDYIPLKFIGPHDGAAIKRVPWNTSKLIGSPEPPPAFRTVNAFPKLKTTQPITIVNEPDRNGFLLLETNGYAPVRKSRLVRLPNDPGAIESEVLLEFDETAFDLCFHPKFAENGWIFLGLNGRFDEGEMDFNNRVVRYTMDRKTGRIDPASRKVFLEWQSHGHNGLGMVFGKDGMFYVTSGDGTSNSDQWDSGQDLARLLAKMLRIDVDHAEDGKPYRVPSDNPFLKTPGARPETWAYGFRNPWRMSIDRETGDLWVGENGQDLWEYARIVHRGENYGWPVVEGSHEFHQNRKPGPTPISKPLIEHSHQDFRSFTGGIVYRGAKFKELVGSYIYGDHSTGQIWAAKQKDGKLTSDAQLARTRLGITNFCETPQGDVLVLDYLGNAIHKLERNMLTVIAARAPFPTKLSDTGLFADTATLKPHPSLISYEVNAPAWHDGATSERFIALPPDARMEFTAQGGWNFPDGSAIAQTLSAGIKRIETRVMLRDGNEWTGYSYAWNDASTDATLVAKEGETREGWRFPGRNECALCHSRHANFLLGVSTLQLNRAGADGGNQIAKWERDGLIAFNHATTEESEWRAEFEKMKLNPADFQSKLALVLRTDLQREPAKQSPLLPHSVESFRKLVDPHDETASIHDRARSYLHANCAHCHEPNGGGNSSMNLAMQVSDNDLGIIKKVPLHTTYGIPDAMLAAPGAPEKSIIFYRTTVRGPGQMPPVGTMKPDGGGVALLVRWLKSLSPGEN